MRTGGFAGAILMPANVIPEYEMADQRYREARSDLEKLVGSAGDDPGIGERPGQALRSILFRNIARA